MRIESIEMKCDFHLCKKIERACEYLNVQAQKKMMQKGRNVKKRSCKKKKKKKIMMMEKKAINGKI